MYDVGTMLVSWSGIYQDTRFDSDGDGPVLFPIAGLHGTKKVPTEPGAYERRMVKLTAVALFHHQLPAPPPKSCPFELSGTEYTIDPLAVEAAETLAGHSHSMPVGTVT